MADQDARDLFDRFNPILEPRPSVAADTKRGVVWVTVDAKHNGVMVTLDSLREQLAAQGLHVVTAAEKAVLDAWSRVPDDTLWLWANHVSGHVRAVCRAELACREAAK